MKLFFCLLLLGSLQGVDLGKHGHTFEIKEESFLEFIQKRLIEASKDGTLLKVQDMLKKRAVKSIKNPKPVGDFELTSEDYSYFYDPTLELTTDIKDHKGNILYKSGTRINPLRAEFMNFNRPLLFFDARDGKQLAMALRSYAHCDWILTGGSPINLMQKYKREIYFDQGGGYARIFGIRRIPCLIDQAPKQYLLRITELKIKE